MLLPLGQEQALLLHARAHHRLLRLTRVRRPHVRHQHVHRQPLIQHIQRLRLTHRPHTHTACHDPRLHHLHLPLQRLQLLQQLLLFVMLGVAHVMLLKVLVSEGIGGMSEDRLLAPQTQRGVVHGGEDDVAEVELELVAGEDVIERVG